MTNKTEGLHNRGYLDKGIEAEFQSLALRERMALLQSKEPRNRTLAARLLINTKVLKSNTDECVTALIKALKKEKKLYPKIEICNSLASFKVDSVKALIDILGQVGNNQHKNLPEKNFKKDSYPLPRDIASRTLTRIGTEALSDLLKFIEHNENRKQISEAIDGIGFICFYNYQAGVYPKLEACYAAWTEDELIQWKLLRAMSAFTESEAFLREQKQVLTNKRLISELKRSLRLIDIRNKDLH